MKLNTTGTNVPWKECSAESNRFLCTLQHGHKGDHIAHGTQGQIIHRWSGGDERDISRETLSVLTPDHRLETADPIDFYPTAEHWGWTRWNLPQEIQG